MKVDSIMRVRIFLRILLAASLLVLISTFMLYRARPNQNTPQRKWFRAVTLVPRTPQGKLKTQLYLNIGKHSILLSLGGSATNTGRSVALEHNNPFEAIQITEDVARVAFPNQTATTLTNASSASSKSSE